jgi:hypothetical protein
MERAFGRQSPPAPAAERTPDRMVIGGDVDSHAHHSTESPPGVLRPSTEMPGISTTLWGQSLDVVVADGRIPQHVVVLTLD